MANSGINKTSTIIGTGLLAGTLDAVAAIIINSGTPPAQIFRFIASGIFAKDAFTGGADMVLTGILLHYLIALCFTALLFLAYPRVKAVFANKYSIAFIYGILVWFVMNLVVIPLSNVQKFPFHTFSVITGIVASIICIGVPISLIADKYYRKIK